MSATIQTTQPSLIRNAPAKILALANKGKNATVEYVGRKVSQIEAEEAKKFGIDAGTLLAMNVAAVGLARTVDYAWNFAVECVAVVVGDTMATPVAFATVALGGAFVIHKINVKDKVKEGHKKPF